MKSIDFLNGSHIECINTDNTTKRSSNAYKPLTFSTSNDDNDKSLLSWLSNEMKEYKEYNANRGHYISVETGVNDLQLFNYNALDNLTLNITIKDSESNTLSTNTKEYIDHCEKLVSKVYTNKEIPDYVKGEKQLYKIYFKDDTKGEKEMTTKTKPNPRNYTILPEIDDYKIYKDKQGRDVAIVVTFTDGTKTKAVCNYDGGDKFDLQCGIAICFMRRLLGDVNIDPKKLDDDKKKSLGYTEYNRFMRKVVRNHEKKIKQAEKEKERKAKELKERQEIEAKRSEKRKKEEMEKLSPIIDILKGLNLNDAMETLRNMTSDNK